MEALAAENEQLRRRLAEVEEESRRLATRLQDLLSDSEARFSAIFRDAALGVLLVDLSERVVMANPAAGRILGRTPGDLQGTPAFELLLGDQGDGGRFEELIRGKRDKYRLDREIDRPDGGTLWVSVTVSLIRGAHGEPHYALALLEDITEHQIAEERTRRLWAEQAARAEVEAARRRIAFLAEASVALSSSLDSNATLTRLANLAVPSLGDYCVVDLVEAGAFRRVAESAVDPELRKFLEGLPRTPSNLSRNGWVYEVAQSRRTRLFASVDGAPLSHDGPTEQFIRLGGSAQPRSLVLIPVRAGDRVFGVMAVGRLSAQRTQSDSDVALAEELARRAALAMENARLYQDAREASRLKDDFLALVSHELRTPLTPILGWLQLLREGDVDQKTLKVGLDTVERNARTQARLVEDLLDMSRVITGKLRLETRPMKLGPMVHEAIEALRPAAEARNIRVTARIDPKAPQVLGDPTRLLQIGWNLLSNAIKFTPAGGAVELIVSSSPGRVLFQVSDTGEGISPDFLPHLFERFRQSEAAMSRRHSGLGLGLSIVRHLAELHGGTVSVQSPGINQGSVFTVSLPALSAPELPMAESEPVIFAPNAVRPSSNVRLDGIKLLVVDDQLDTLSLLTQILQNLGAKVRMASSAAEAYKAFLEEAPDVLISDLGMPEEDGFSFIKRIRALAPSMGGRVPAIALTAFARPEDRARALSSGFQSHIAKPIEGAQLAAVIASFAPEPPQKPAPAKRSKARKAAPPRGSRKSRAGSSEP